MTAATESYPVEIVPPDITPYQRSNTGIDWIWTFEGPAPGPHVALTALVHGNEPCGAIALDDLFRRDIRPLRGKLSLAFINPEAYLRFDPNDPMRSRWVDQDFNRLWAPALLSGPGDSVELRRARSIRPWLETVDLVLDIHSMQQRTAPLILAGVQPRALDLAATLPVPSIIVLDRGHAAGPRMRDYSSFDDPASAKTALLVECGQHWQQATAELALQTSIWFLRSCQMVDSGFGADVVAGTAPSPARQVVEVSGPVTIETDAFRFVEPFRGMEVIAKGGTIIGYDGVKPVRTPYDDCVLIMPSRRLWRGQTAVRLGRFIPP
ncbi:MAG: succinylglutamate desuccinylase/aspartoacylase family protein [Geminicoccaceae bacterium]